MFRIILCQYRSLQAAIIRCAERLPLIEHSACGNGARVIAFAHRPFRQIAVLMYSNGSTMKDDEKSQRQSGKAKDLRHERLKQALRENLKRRKSQGKGREEITPSSNPDDVAAGETGKKHPGK